MSLPGFPPPISHHLSPCPEAVMTSNIWWPCPCIISVRHHGLRTLYKSVGNYRLGLFSLDTQQHRVRGRTWIEGTVISKFGKWAPWHSSPRFASPWMLLWTTSVEYYFCVSCKHWPVRIQAALVINYYKRVGIEGTAPGVGPGKELSLSAEDGVHPNPVAHGLTQTARRPVTYMEELGPIKWDAQLSWSRTKWGPMYWCNFGVSSLRARSHQNLVPAFVICYYWALFADAKNGYQTPSVVSICK